MERTGLGDLSWVGRVRLLDDLPTRGDTSSDLLGLVPQARSLAGSLLRNAGRPMVLHIDGAWGRGKTSFCRMLESQLFELQKELEQSDDLNDAQDVCVTNYIASDAEATGQRAVMYQVLRAVLAEDPEEIASLMGQFSLDEDGGQGEATFDRFRAWLGKELGWTGQQLPPPATRIPLESGPGVFDEDPQNSASIEKPVQAESGARYANHGSTGRLELKIKPRRRKLAVVFIDDLDRCNPEWVSRLLDTVRRYVDCLGVSFVVAADRKVIERAFDDVVARLGVHNELSGARALEKYVRHSVRIPRWGFDADRQLSTKLVDLQRQLGSDGDELALLYAPPGDLRNGLAFRLATYLPYSLTVRRLKRLLNKFTMNVARFADLAQVLPEDLQIDPPGRAWAKLNDLQPEFGNPEPVRENYAAYFFGQVIVSTLNEVWPAAVSDIPLDSDEFQQRMRAFAMLGSGLRASKHKPATLSLGLFQLILDALVPQENDGGTSLEIKRELCEFIASLYDDLGIDGRFVPRRALYPTQDRKTQSEASQPARPEAGGGAERSDTPGDASPTAAPASGKDAPPVDAEPGPGRAGVKKTTVKTANEQERLDEVATELNSIFRVLESDPNALHAALLARSIGVTKSLDPEPPAQIQDILHRYANMRWPAEASFAGVEFAGELKRLGLSPDAFTLLLRLYQTVVSIPADSISNAQQTAMVWSISELLIELASEYPYLLQKLATNTNFPPSKPPDCASAWRAALTLAELGEEPGSPLQLNLSFFNQLSRPLSILVNALPALAWPARLLLKVVRIGDTQFVSHVRKIAERIPRESYGLDQNDEVDMVLATIRFLEASPSENELVISLYDFLEKEGVLPASELHRLAWLYRDANKPAEAGRCFEQAYRMNALDDQGISDFLVLLEEQKNDKIAPRILEKARLEEDEHPFGRPLPKAVDMESTAPDLFSVDYVKSAQNVLQDLRDIEIDTLEGPLGELVPRLFARAAQEPNSKSRLKVEAAAWAELALPAGARLPIELSRAMSAQGLHLEAREMLRAASPAITQETGDFSQLLWQLLAKEVAILKEANLTIDSDEELFAGGIIPLYPPLSEATWEAALDAVARGFGAHLAPAMLEWTMQSVRQVIDDVPGWLLGPVVKIVEARPYISNPDEFVPLLQAALTNRLMNREQFDEITRNLIFSIPAGGYWGPSLEPLLREFAESGAFTAADFAYLAETVSAPASNLPADLVQRIQATAYATGSRGDWVETFADSLPRRKKVDRETREMILAGKDVEDPGVELLPVAQEPGDG